MSPTGSWTTSITQAALILRPTTLPTSTRCSTFIHCLGWLWAAIFNTSFAPCEKLATSVPSFTFRRLAFTQQGPQEHWFLNQRLCSRCSWSCAIACFSNGAWRHFKPADVESNVRLKKSREGISARGKPRDKEATTVGATCTRTGFQGYRMRCSLSENRL